MSDDDQPWHIDIEDWHRPVDDVEQAVLTGLVGPVLEVGCGPGRLVAELARTGRPALGIDVGPAAVALANANGAPILRYSVFDRLPGEGRWPTVLVFDGSVGMVLANPQWGPKSFIRGKR